jgi:hypothetical protein
MAGQKQRAGEKMTKIKNFRVNLRPREIARWLKKERGVETTPELELTIAEAIKEARKWVTPAAVYTTLTRKTAEKTTTIAMPPEAVALSVAVVSIGTGLEAERKNAQPGSPRDMLLSAIEQEALAQSLQFTVRLIGEQAEEEDCEMSSPVSVQEAPVASSLATLLGVARIGIQFDPSAPEPPPYVRVSYWFWTPAGKGPSRRAEPAGRAEKVAA